MKKELVGMADYKICKAPETLGIIGLGSCAAVALYHDKSKTGVLAHIMLPEGEPKEGTKPAKYANTAIKIMVEEMKKIVGNSGHITAKIAGGAQMFKITKGFAIGENNILVVKKELKAAGIKITGEDTGKNYGRNVTFSLENGAVKIKCVNGEYLI